MKRSRGMNPRLGFVSTLILLLTAKDLLAGDIFKIDDAGFRANAVPVLKQFCFDCHGRDKQEGDFRVDEQLSPLMTDRAVAARWAEVVNMLNSHEMPPEESKQPDAKVVARLVDWVTAEMKRAEQFNRTTDVVLRRLNRAEYKNTIRDLIGVDFDVSDFPEDASAGGFDNNGAALSMSAMQVELYLEAAREILDEAIVIGNQPESIRWRFEPESGDSDRNRVRYGDNNAIVNGGNNPVHGNGRLIAFDQWNKKINARDFRVPTSGPYIIRIRAGGRTPSRDEVVQFAEAFYDKRFEKRMKEKPADERHYRYEMDRDMKHARNSWTYQYGPPRIRVTVHQDGQPEVIGETDVTGGMTEGSLQTISFPVKMSTANAGITLQNSYTLRRVLENIQYFGNEDFPRPTLLIDWFEIEGPVYPQWLPASHTSLFPNPIPESKPDQHAYAEEILTRFMPRAFRRPVEPAEVEAKLELYDVARESTGSFVDGMKVALTSVLVSPQFLYLAEPRSDGRLTDFEIASRMSYFLWSTMPDERLLTLAREGRLQTGKTRAGEVDRMLQDPRSDAFVENFAGQWLGLREVGSNPPVEDLYPRYDPHLEESCVHESLAFFRELLHNDLSLDNFIDSDFAMLNERMARFYEIPDVRGDDFRRVAIDADTHRGGVMTQLSVLSTTSNGTRTTPVKRGTWILKTLLDQDPGLPVANAGEISPKVPGLDKATVRQRLEIHRELPQCARCHDKIDPLGFALENYNAAGEWRTQEGFGYQGRVNRDDPKIDASGTLPDGTKIDGIDGLKRALLKQRKTLHESLATNLFSYALGRKMTLVDRDDLNRAVKLADTYRDDLRTLIKAIVTSEAFTK